MPLPFNDGQVGSSQEVNHDFSAWTGGAGASVVLASPHHGSYAFLIDSATDNEYYAWGVATTDGYIRAMVYFTSLPTSGNTVVVFDLWAITYSDPRLLVKNNAGTMQIGVRANDGTTAFVNYPFVTGTWYCLELGYVQSTKTVTAYVSGVSQVSKACANTDTMSRGYIGWTATAAQMYVDCVVMDDAFIGCDTEIGGGLSVPVAMHHYSILMNGGQG